MDVVEWSGFKEYQVVGHVIQPWLNHKSKTLFHKPLPQKTISNLNN